MSRGIIQNIARAQQINSFKNLQYGKITPTDMDGCIEYKNKAYIFLEVKYKDKELPFGQKLAIERLVNDTSVKKISLAIICEHYIENPQEQVDVATCNVRELYFSSEKIWRPPIKVMSVRKLIDLFIYSVVEEGNNGNTITNTNTTGYS